MITFIQWNHKIKYGEIIYYSYFFVTFFWTLKCAALPHPANPLRCSCKYWWCNELRLRITGKTSFLSSLDGFGCRDVVVRGDAMSFSPPHHLQTREPSAAFWWIYVWFPKRVGGWVKPPSSRLCYGGSFHRAAARKIQISCFLFISVVDLLRCVDCGLSGSIETPSGVVFVDTWWCCPLQNSSWLHRFLFFQIQ